MITGGEGQVFAELIADDGVLLVLPPAENQIGKMGDPAAEKIVIELLCTVTAAELQAQALLAEGQAGVTVQTDAAGHRKAAAVVIKGKTAAPLLPFQAFLEHVTEGGLVVADQTDDREGEVFTDEVIERQHPAGQSPRLCGKGTDGAADRDGGKSRKSLGRKGRNTSVHSVIDGPRGLQIKQHGFASVKHPIRRQCLRCGRDPPVSVCVFAAGADGGEEKAAVASGHAAEASAERNVTQDQPVLQSAFLLREKQGFVFRVQLQTQPIAADHGEGTRVKRTRRKNSFFQVVRIVRQIPAGKTDGGGGDIFQLNPVAAAEIRRV